MIFSQKKLNSASIADLKAIRDLIDSGIYDGTSTDRLSAEARGYDDKSERYKKILYKRHKLLGSINRALNTKINQLSVQRKIKNK